ncbi:Rieske [2Fe-2S] domain-containing protein [Verrucomicrobium sp. GAS474]|uniref:QcrA and Rieske domain-containing protein n=1 Tax=Verrucomicrobium sp. GAS474 TaxID=1882831 RepID=UPI00087D2F6F|nr:Rieske 2Fe-2S domain-containing protein [Verrucomicrobium sp. GAS474]SDU22700.1 Rieske [2Fe-2S] domain-containing protein [Verrucomicrobium sp. GAS474]
MSNDSTSGGCCGGHDHSHDAVAPGAQPHTHVEGEGCCGGHDHDHGGHGHGASKPLFDGPIFKNDFERREFLKTAIPGAIAGAVLTVPIAGYMVLPSIEGNKHRFVSVGPIDKFVVGETVLVELANPDDFSWAGVTSKVAAWVRRESETDFIAFSVNCSHLGCPVRWLPKAKLFMCPCHGGVYNKDGNVVAGPPPKSLNRYEVRTEGGEVQLMTQPIFLA